jgi:hypothetical protein
MKSAAYPHKPAGLTVCCLYDRPGWCFALYGWLSVGLHLLFKVLVLPLGKSELTGGRASFAMVYWRAGAQRTIPLRRALATASDLEWTCSFS